MSNAFSAIDATGYEPHIGPVEVSEDGARLRLRIEDHHLNGANMLHGGMMMSFAAMALRHAAEADAGRPVEALSVNCDFVGPGKPGTVAEAETEVTRRTRTVVFLNAAVVSGDDTLMVATGVFRIPADEGGK